MNNIKMTSVIVSLILVLSVGYRIADQRITAVTRASTANMKLYDNVDDLMKDACLVVEATVTSNSKQIDLHNEYADSYTLTEVNIDKIIKDDAKDTGSQIAAVIEPAYTVDNGVIPGKTLITTDEYSRLVPDAKYVLFLNWSEFYQAYFIHALYQGKMNVDGKDKDEKDLYLRHGEFKKLKDSALSKLMY